MDSAPHAAARYCHRCQTPLATWAKGSTCPACMMASSSLFGGKPSRAPEPPLSLEENGPLDQPLVFGDYLLEKQINHGGMGVVYRARQLSLNRTVAVKLLLLGRYSSDESRMRFRREAQSAAQLRHPNIVSVYEVGDCDDQPFIAMEYVDGGSLADRLRTGPLPAREAAEVIKVVAGAIEYAHHRGVMHRDVKPSNLLVSANGSVHVTDFGLAKQIDGTSDVTLSGRMLGTPNYLPPEAISGNSASFGARGDVYSLGAVLYETLTGRPPFLSGSLAETLRRIVETDPVAPHTLNPAVPRDLETICLKALARDPSRRFASPKELAQELGRWLSGEPIHTRRTGWPERLVKWARRKPAIATLTALTIFAATAAVSTLLVSYHHISEAQIQAEQSRVAAEAESAAHVRTVIHFQVTEGLSLVQQKENFAGMLHFAEALRQEKNPQQAAMHRRRMAAARLTAVHLKSMWLDERRGGFPHFSPDGRKIIFSSKANGVALYDVEKDTTTVPFTALPDNISAATAWLAKDDAAWVLDTTQRLRRLSPLNLQPDGPVVDTLIVNDARLAMNGVHFDRSRGHFIAVLKNGGASVFDAVTGARVSPALAAGEPATHARLSADGSRAVVCTGKTKVTLFDRLAGTPLFTLQAGGEVRWLEINSDASRVLLVRDSAAKNQATVEWWSTAPGTAAPQWTDNVGTEIFSCGISPDNRTLAIGTSGAGLLLQDAAAPKYAPRQIRSSGGVWDLDFSSDSTRLITACSDGRAQLWDVRTGQQLRCNLPHPDIVLQAEFSASAEYLITSGEQGIRRLWRLKLDPDKFQVIPFSAEVAQKVFNRDGTRILLTARKVLRIQEPGRETPIIEIHLPGEITAADWNRAGTRVLAGCRDGSVCIVDAATGSVSFQEELPLRPGAPQTPDARKIVRVHFSSDDSTFLAAAGSGIVRRWRSTAGQPPVIKDWIHTNLVRDAKFSPDGSMALTAGADRKFNLWDAASGDLIFSGEPKWDIQGVDFSPDSWRFSLAGWDAGFDPRPAQIWNIATQRQIGPDLFQSDGLYQALFSPDGKMLLTSGEDGRAVLWDAGTGAKLTVLPKGRVLAHAAAFSPNSDMAVTFKRGPAQVYDVISADPVTVPIPFDAVNCDWNAGNNILATSSKTQTVLWNLSPAPESPENLRLEAEVSACQHLDGLSGQLPLNRFEIMARWNKLHWTSSAVAYFEK